MGRLQLCGGGGGGVDFVGTYGGPSENNSIKSINKLFDDQEDKYYLAITLIFLGIVYNFSTMSQNISPRSSKFLN